VGGIADQTIVDVVTSDHIGEYAATLREAFGRIAAIADIANLGRPH
jgi:hypothetical protein